MDKDYFINKELREEKTRLSELFFGKKENNILDTDTIIKASKLQNEILDKMFKNISGF